MFSFLFSGGKNGDDQTPPDNAAASPQCPAPPSGHKWEITYFAHRGRADLALILLKLAGEDVNVRWIIWATFVALRDECNAFPFRYLPTMLHEESGQVISESKALARLGAKVAKLIPDDPVIAAQADSFVDRLMDMKTIQFYVPGTPSDLVEQCRVQLEATCNALKAVMAMQEGDSDWLLGDKMCWADVSLFVEVDGLSLWDPELMAWFETAFPKLHQIVERVRSLPVVTKLLNDTEWSKGASWPPNFSYGPGSKCGCVRKGPCCDE
mmetsp:Transcript_21966/g.32331  ORF Transcript_21966/g.32331 Transcript_21966/m.32331 type:complete len:267 (-) Transcript_21966:2342-3142(-)